MKNKRLIFIGVIVVGLVLASKKITAQNSNDYKSIDASIQETIGFLNSSVIRDHKEVEWYIMGQFESFYSRNGVFMPMAYRVKSQSNVKFDSLCNMIISFDRTYYQSSASKKQRYSREIGGITIPLSKLTHGNVKLLPNVFSGQQYVNNLGYNYGAGYYMIIINATGDNVFDVEGEQFVGDERVMEGVGLQKYPYQYIESKQKRYKTDKQIKLIIKYQTDCSKRDCMIEPERVVKAIQYLIYKCGGSEDISSKF